MDSFLTIDYDNKYFKYWDVDEQDIDLFCVTPEPGNIYDFNEREKIEKLLKDGLEVVSTDTINVNIFLVEGDDCRTAMIDDNIVFNEFRALDIKKEYDNTDLLKIIECVKRNYTYFFGD